jgi:hypothetical protein
MPQRYVIPRYTGVVYLAEPRRSYMVRRLDDGIGATLSRCEASRTNYRLRVGDKVRFCVYSNSRGGMSAFDPVLLDDISRHRKPIRKLPPYYALGPVVRIGVAWRR